MTDNEKFLFDLWGYVVVEEGTYSRRGRAGERSG